VIDNGRLQCFGRGMQPTAEVVVKPGIKSTELWSKLLIQLVLVLNRKLDLGIELDGETSMLIVAGLEALYQAGRPLVKRAAYQAQTKVTVQ